MIGRMIVREIAEPLVRRAGTALAAALIAQGIPAELAEQVRLGAVAAALIGADLVSSALARRR